MRPGEILKKADEMGLDRKWALNCRKRFLSGEIFECEMNFYYWMDRDSEDPVVAEMFVVLAVEEIKKIAKLKLEIRKLDKSLNRVDEFAITDEMIVQARAYPIERLIHFERNAALAFCHADKSPSLTWDKKRNRAKCWPCGKSFDSIAVLVERDGMKFKDAVRELSR